MKKCLIVLCFLLLFGISVISCSNETESDEVAGDETAIERDDVDVDLTGLSQTIVQAEFQNILSNTDNYIGKTIRASGTYYTLFSDKTGNHYHYIIIVQGDECCQLGFEFKRDGDYAVPDDYPKKNAVIEVTGILKRYEELGNSYLYLAVKDITVK